jgi:hypothetical protein
VMAYLRSDLMALYQKAGLIEAGEIPIINADLLDLKERLNWACMHREVLIDLGKQGREYVIRHHSIEKLGQDFSGILQAVGILPE